MLRAEPHLFIKRTPSVAKLEPEMGCAGSVPKAEAFLANPQPAPPGGYLLDGVPASVVMEAWSIFDHGNRYHVDGGVLGAVNMFAGAEALLVGDAGNNELRDYAVGAAGVGARETLAITADDGTPIGTLSMPPHMSFGQPAQLRDAAGNIVAVIMTAQTSRPSGFQASAVKVWGVKPQFAGQAPTAFADGSQAYLWAEIKRAGFSNTTTIVDGQGTFVAKCARIRGWNDRFKIMTPSKTGLAICDTLKTDKKKQQFTCAQGVDVAWTICLVAATQMSSDELHVSRDEHGRGDMAGGDD